MSHKTRIDNVASRVPKETWQHCAKRNDLTHAAVLDAALYLVEHDIETMRAMAARANMAVDEFVAAARRIIQEERAELKNGNTVHA